MQHNDLDIDQYMSNKYRIKPVQNSSNHNHQSTRSQDQQFFEYVRQKKYKQAYNLGQAIIERRPGASGKSVATFCQYILKNLLDEGDECRDEDGEDGVQESEEEQTGSESEEESSGQESQQQQQQDQQSSKSCGTQQNKTHTQISSNQPQPIKPLTQQQSQLQIIRSRPQNRQLSHVQVPRLAFYNNGSNIVEGISTKIEKQSLKNIINIRLNQENQQERQKRYRTDVSDMRGIKLPYLAAGKTASGKEKNDKENKDKKMSTKANTIIPNNKRRNYRTSQ